MRDSIGGIVNIFMIAVFLLVVSGYLAFSVSYNRAFRVKNKIITLLEQNGTFEGAKPKIEQYIKEVGYNAYNMKNSTGCSNIHNANAYYECGQGYCVTWIDTSDDKQSTTEETDDIKSGYFKVTTAVNIDVPIINKVMPHLQIFYVSGDTITIYEDNSAEFNKSCR